MQIIYSDNEAISLLREAIEYHLPRLREFSWCPPEAVRMYHKLYATLENMSMDGYNFSKEDKKYFSILYFSKINNLLPSVGV